MSDPTPSDLMERRKAAEYLDAYASQSSLMVAWQLRTVAQDIRDGEHLTDSVRIHVPPYEVVEAEERAKHPRWHSGVWRTARDIADEFPRLPRVDDSARCSQCGNNFEKPACGPTHALIADERRRVEEAINEELKRRAEVPQRDGMGFSADLFSSEEG